MSGNLCSCVFCRASGPDLNLVTTEDNYANQVKSGNNKTIILLDCCDICNIVYALAVLLNPHSYDQRGYEVM